MATGFKEMLCGKHADALLRTVESAHHLSATIAQETKPGVRCECRLTESTFEYSTWMSGQRLQAD